MSFKKSMRTINRLAREAERDAKRREREQEKQEREYQKQLEFETALGETEAYELNLEQLTSFHKACSTPINWQARSSSDPPNPPVRTTRNEDIAQQTLDAYKPSISDRILKREDRKRDELSQAVQAAKLLDDQELTDAKDRYEKQLAEWETKKKIAAGILEGKTESYMEAVSYIDPFTIIDGIGRSIDFNMQEDNNRVIECTLQVNKEDVVPKQEKRVLKSGKLSVRDIAKTKYYALYQDHICSAVLRVAREIFALLPVDMAIITAESELINTQTGYLEETPILSVAIPARTLNSLNFDFIDPSDALSNFLHNVKFMKTKGFQAVEMIDVSKMEI